MKYTDELSIVLAGPAGMGVQTVEYLFTKILKWAGYNVFSTKEYMSRVRGGTNSTQIRVASRPVRAFVKRIDLAVPLNQGALEHIQWRMSDQTLIMADLDVLGGDADPYGDCALNVPFTGIANEIGNKLYANIVAVGALSSLFGIELDLISDAIRQAFQKKDDKIIEGNIAAAKEGCRVGAELIEQGRIAVDVRPDDAVAKQAFYSGTEAIGMGALAGNCDLVSSYPMSPSTGVLIFMAKNSLNFDCIVEQAEDEIAAINMACGAWYAGARGMVTTSGGGFALMTEGVSLAGIIESPMVIHIAQRPGPGTGLPTRTEQGDLELALYAGHGEFPRAVFAPGTLNQGVELTQAAFNLADKHQVPVFVLSDQYYVDSFYNTDPVKLGDLPIEKHIVETAEGYARYAMTDSGVSPRGVPAHGKGLVGVDSDEHTEDAHITESRDVRVAMNDKRLRKLDGLMQEIIPPTLWPEIDYKNLVICWGSTFHIVAEAVEKLGRDDTAVLHFSQVYPLHPDTAQRLNRAEKRILIEGNATSQFGRVLKLHAGVDIEHHILKYDGLTFFVEEVHEQLQQILA